MDKERDIKGRFLKGHSPLRDKKTGRFVSLTTYMRTSMEPIMIRNPTTFTTLTIV